MLAIGSLSLKALKLRLAVKMSAMINSGNAPMPVVRRIFPPADDLAQPVVGATMVRAVSRWWSYVLRYQ